MTKVQFVLMVEYINYTAGIVCACGKISEVFEQENPHCPECKLEIKFFVNLTPKK